MVGILFAGCVGTYVPRESSSSRHSAKTRGCGGTLVPISDWSSGFVELHYTSKACAERSERERAKVSLREPNEVFQSVYVKIENYYITHNNADIHHLLSTTDYYEMIVLKDEIPVYRVKSGSVQIESMSVLEAYEDRPEQVYKTYISSMEWIDREDIELPIEIVIVRLKGLPSAPSRIAHYRVDPRLSRLQERK